MFGRTRFAFDACCFRLIGICIDEGFVVNVVLFGFVDYFTWLNC